MSSCNSERGLKYHSYCQSLIALVFIQLPALILSPSLRLLSKNNLVMLLTLALTLTLCKRGFPPPTQCEINMPILATKNELI